VETEKKKERNLESGSLNTTIWPETDSGAVFIFLLNYLVNHRLWSDVKSKM